jgi:hypothetical protein
MRSMSFQSALRSGHQIGRDYRFDNEPGLLPADQLRAANLRHDIALSKRPGWHPALELDHRLTNKELDPEVWDHLTAIYGRSVP